MTKATSQRGMTYNYAYNARGLATSLEAKNSAGTMSLKSDVEYSANGRFVTKTYDQDGRSDTYNYNTTTGFLDSVTDDDTNTTINYSYNTNNGNLLSASQTVNSENITVSNNYSYSSAGNLLTKINRNDTSYNIEYDKFNNTTVNKVGSQVLTSFDYGSNNGILQKVTSCNPFYAEYKKKQKARTSPKKYNNSAFAEQYVTVNYTEYYGSWGSPIKTYSGMGTSSSTGQPSGPIKIYSNYINNEIFSSRIGVSGLNTDINIGFNGIKISKGLNFVNFTNYISLEYLSSEHMLKIGWDSNYSSEGVTYYNNGGICIDEKPIMLSFAAACVCPLFHLH